MKSHRLIHIIGKWNKSFIDLLIVIVGVSVAFLLSNINETVKVKKEREKVMSSLKLELEFLSSRFPGMADWQEYKNTSWDSLLELQQIDDYYLYYYLQPQHNYSVLEYAIDTRNTQIVDFALHQKLLMLHKSIKMLEESEVYMTQIALSYHNTDQGSHTLVSPHNLFMFRRFIGFAKNRAIIMKRIAQISDETLPLLEK